MAAVPAPCVGDYLIKSALRGPAKQFSSLFVGSAEHRRVARTSGLDFRGNLFAGDAACRFDYLLYRIAVAAAEVEDTALVLTLEVFEGKQVSFYQIANMDVVADAGAVSGGVFITRGIRWDSGL